MSNEKNKNQNEEEIIELNEDEILQLIDEDGNPEDFYWYGTVELDGQTYVAFEPAEPKEEDEDGVVIFKLVEEEDNDVFEPVQDDALLDKIIAEFEKLEKEQEEKGCGCKTDKKCGCDKDCDCK